MKRGELSTEVIVVAAIAVLVLAVLAWMFLAKVGPFAEQTKCEGTGGTCVDGACGPGMASSKGKCDVEGQTCCLPVDVAT